MKTRSFWPLPLLFILFYFIGGWRGGGEERHSLVPLTSANVVSECFGLHIPVYFISIYLSLLPKKRFSFSSH